MTNERWVALIDERDSMGLLTDMAQALDAIREYGCDCETGTCIACRCETALRAERERAEKAEAERDALRARIAAGEEKLICDACQPIDSASVMYRGLKQEPLHRPCMLPLRRVIVLDVESGEEKADE